MRPSKFTKEITEKIIKLRREGASIQMCADMVGISESTIRAWVKKGEKAKTGQYREFYRNMKKGKSSVCDVSPEKNEQNQRVEKPPLCRSPSIS